MSVPMSDHTKACVYAELLEEAAEKFRHYSHQHLAKVENWKRQVGEATSPQAVASLEAQIADTMIKAEVNAEIAFRIDAALAG